MPWTEFEIDITLRPEAERLRLRSSSMHVDGEYKSSLPEVIFKNQEDESQLRSKKAINITYGYSHDHRPDLKQFLLELICSSDGDIPIFFKSASGNQSDSHSFGKIAIEYKKQTQIDSLMVADYALYTEENIKLMSEIKWLSRVTLSIKEAELLVSTTPESEFIKSELLGYSFVVKTNNYGGIKQRWLVVQSQERKESDH
ncbi:MAG: IS1634 family transposase [Nostoc sp.]